MDARMLHGGKALKRLRSTVFITVVSGMFIGSIYAARRSPRTIRIDEIRPYMGFSRVCVQGVVASEVRFLSDGTRFFLLADGTGTLPLLVCGAAGHEDLRIGNRIAVCGNLGPGGGSRACLRVPHAGQIEMLGEAEPATVRGTVIEKITPPPGSRAPCRLILERPEGRIEVVYWFVPPLEADAGDRIEAEGTHGIYRGRMQLKVHDKGDIRLQSDR